MIKIKPQERAAIIDALQAGVVPPEGLHHIAAARSPELHEVISDFKEVTAGASKIRFVIGEYGSGKSFLLTLAALMAREHNFVTTQLDITTEKVLYSRDSKAQAFYSGLVKNLTVKTKPGKGALQQIIETWITRKGGSRGRATGDTLIKQPAYCKEYVSGHDFAHIICSYYKGYNSGNERLMDNCLRYLAGEYQNRQDAKKELSVSSIISDENYYDYLKLLNRFIHDAGYSGLLICVDELAVLTRLGSQARTGNYETILNIYNDCLQSSLSGLYLLFGGTVEFLKHPTRGLYSYGALKTRLEGNPFADKHHRQLSGPVIELQNMTGEELCAVFSNIRQVYGGDKNGTCLIDDAEIKCFVRCLLLQMGAESFLTPREAIKKYIHLLFMLEKCPDKSWRDFFKTSPVDDKNKSRPERSCLTELKELKL